MSSNLGRIGLQLTAILSLDTLNGDRPVAVVICSNSLGGSLRLDEIFLETTNVELRDMFMNVDRECVGSN